uniref:Uncharacterized protein n=1 Tax=Laurencieae sp. TaxID=2007162 RepID=A0A1Z1M260_9FLOR|nr:hypothetical protein [Laurencieae sp.]
MIILVCRKKLNCNYVLNTKYHYLSLIDFCFKLYNLVLIC